MHFNAILIFFLCSKRAQSYSIVWEYFQDIDRYPSAKATLLIGRAEALTASHQRGGLDALRAARLAPTQPRTWWALRDAMVAAKKPHAALTALRALYESTADATMKKSICTDAAVLCKDSTVNHSFCTQVKA